MYKYVKKGCMSVSSDLKYFAVLVLFFPSKILFYLPMCYWSAKTNTNLRSRIPWDYKENKENIAVFVAIYGLLLFFYGMYSMCMNTAFVPLGPILLHLLVLDICKYFGAPFSAHTVRWT